ncbi:hypothetical protein [Aeromicrobium sp. CTD01-1L150]|uniref:hypothetical protein n=1 Tax=Aeromicrobium sp. CTD01-1L150 TaxID=3341830 RepID=UPI0035C0C07E
MIAVIIVVLGVVDGEPFGTIIGGAIGDALGIAIQVAFWTTLTFALIDRFGTEAEAPVWSVDEIPDLRPAARSPRRRRSSRSPSTWP